SETLRAVGVARGVIRRPPRHVEKGFRDVDTDHCRSDHALLLAMRALGPCNRSSRDQAAAEHAELRAWCPRITRSGRRVPTSRKARNAAVLHQAQDTRMRAFFSASLSAMPFSLFLILSARAARSRRTQGADAMQPPSPTPAP